MEDKAAADAATDSLVSRMAAVLAAQIEAALSKRDAVIESLQASVDSMKKEFVAVKQDFATIKEDMVSLGTTVRQAEEGTGTPTSRAAGKVGEKDRSVTFVTSLEETQAPLAGAKPSGGMKLDPVRPKSGTLSSPPSLSPTSSGKGAGKKGPISPNRSTEGKLLPDLGLPRVANLNEKGHVEERAYKLQQHELRKISAVRYTNKICASTVFIPSQYFKDDHEIALPTSAPDSDLELLWVHGYHNSGMYTSTGSTNMFYLLSGEVITYTSATVFISDIVDGKQRFFNRHDDDITCLAVHPNGVVVATGQVGKYPRICVWDTGAAAWEKSLPFEEGGPKEYPVNPQPLGDFLDHDRGVGSVDFSHDGKLIVSIGMDDAKTIYIHDWDNGVLIATAKGHSGPVSSIKFNPYQAFGFPNDDEAVPGQSLYHEEASYTLTSHGERHIKFWTLYHKQDPDTYEKSWVLEGSLAKSGALSELQDITCLSFVDDGQVLKKHFPEAFDFIELTQDPLKYYDDFDGAVKPTDRSIGRIFAGTSSGDINVYMQETGDIIGYRDELPDKKTMSTIGGGAAAKKAGGGRRVPVSIKDFKTTTEIPSYALWWEELGGDGDGGRRVLSWKQNAQLVHIIPGTVDRANMLFLSETELEKIASIDKQLRSRPRDEALKSTRQDLYYKGPTAHDGAVTSLEYNRERRQLLSGGEDGKIILWHVPPLSQLDAQCKDIKTFSSRERANRSNRMVVKLKVLNNFGGKAIQVPNSISWGRSYFRHILNRGSEGATSSTTKSSHISPKHQKRLSVQIKQDQSHYSRCRDRIIIGTTANSIFELKYSAIGDNTRFGAPSIDLTPEVITTVSENHCSTVTGVATHPSLPMFVTASKDKNMFLYHMTQSKSAQRGRVPSPAMCICFHPLRNLICVGMENGEIAVYECHGDNVPSKEGLCIICNKDLCVECASCRFDKCLKGSVEAGKFCIREECSHMRMLLRRGTGKAEKSNGIILTDFQKKFNQSHSKVPKRFKEAEEVSCVRYSPKGHRLAAGTRENTIHIFDEKYRRLSVCKGHSSFITQLDWDIGGKVIQSNSGDYEILYWNADSGSQIKTAFDMRDKEWHRWSCIWGWPVRGIWDKDMDGTDINCLRRSNGGDLLITGDDKFRIRLMRWPAVEGAQSKNYCGHCSHVLDAAWTIDDSMCISTGGEDGSVFVWKHSKPCLTASSPKVHSPHRPVSPPSSPTAPTKSSPNKKRPASAKGREGEPIRDKITIISTAGAPMPTVQASAASAMDRGQAKFIKNTEDSEELIGEAEEVARLLMERRQSTTL